MSRFGSPGRVAWNLAKPVVSTTLTEPNLYPRLLAMDEYSAKTPYCGLLAELSARVAVVRPADWSQRCGLVLVSAKNPLFSTEVLEASLSLSVEHCSRTTLSLVDQPYFATLDPSDEQAVRRTTNTIEERSRWIARVLERSGLNVHATPWAHVSAHVPETVRTEVRAAINTTGRLWDLVCEQAASVLGEDRVNEDPQRWTAFLRAELPVLFSLYYFSPQPAVDFYPGPQAELFYELEDGGLSKELPLVTERAQARPLVYVDLLAIDSTQHQTGSNRSQHALRC